jgi:hypothetical protein
MLKRLILVVVLAALAARPAATRAWGLEVHRLITARAIDGLPEPLHARFASDRAFVVEHAVDPDLWRVVDLRGNLGTEAANHFLDIDALDEPAPYAGVPRDWKAFVARYGSRRASSAGRLPWRAADIYGRLVTAFKATGTTPYAADDARYLSAVLAHYVEDAFQPLHTVANYDGQLTGQKGIHSRFETALTLRNWPGLKQTRVTVRPVPDVIAFMFTTITESAALAPAILAADERAAAGRPRTADGPTYDDAYYAALLKDLRPVLETRLSAAADGVASLIVAAWQEGGGR